MSNYITLTIPGDPISQQRPRLFRRGRNTHCFDPQSREKHEVKQYIQSKLEDKEWSYPTYPKVNLFFYMPVPKSFAKEDRALAVNEKLRHIKKPDVDNLIKFYLDCMSGLVLKDDNCVSIGKAMKIYSNNPRTTIFVEDQSKYISEVDIYG